MEIWFLFFPEFFSHLLYMKSILFILAFANASEDDSLCVESMHSLLPEPSIPAVNSTSRKALINALIQVDQTLGITPCQYAKTKLGFDVSDGNARLGTEAEQYEQVDTSKVVNEQMKAMQAASDQSVYGQGRNTKNKAYEFGRMIGKAPIDALASATTATLKGLSHALDETVHFFGANVDLDLDIFHDLKVDEVGKWINHAGHAIGDAAVDTAFVFGGVFSGIGEAIGGPSVQGRRRVVFDIDCDFLEHDVDTMETHCEAYRYNRLKFLYPAVRGIGDLHMGVMNNVTKLNNTFYGNNLTFDKSIREIFDLNRDTLYGKNGSCLEPKAQSVAGFSNSLATDTMKTFDSIGTVLDTLWSNVMIIDQSTKSGILNLVEDYANNTQALMKMSQDNQKYLHDDSFKALNAMADKLSWYAGNNTNKMVKRQIKTANNTGKTTERLENFVFSAIKTLTRLSSRLDDATDILSGSPDTMDKFVTTIMKGGSLVMDSANDESQRTARETVESVINKKSQQVINQFDAAAASALRSSEKDLNVSMKGVMSSASINTRKGVSKLKTSESMVNAQFSAAKQGLMSNISNMAIANAISINEAQTLASDLSDMGTVARKSTDASFSNIRKLTRGLRDSGEETISNTQTQVSNVLSAEAKGAGEQMNAISDTIKNAGSALSDQTINLDTHLGQLAERAAHAISDSVSKNRRSAANRAQLDQMRKNADNARLEAANNLASVTSSDATATWENLGNDALSKLNSIASDATEYRGRAKSDTDRALSSTEDVLEDNSYIQNQATHDSVRGIFSDLSEVGKSTLGLTRSAGDDLSGSDDMSRLNLGLISGLFEQLGASNPSDIASLFNSINKIDSESESQFDGKFKSVLGDSNSKLQSVLSMILANGNKLETNGKISMDKIKAAMANSVTRAQSSDAGFDSKDMDLVSILESLQEKSDGVLKSSSRKKSPTSQLLDDLYDSSVSPKNALANLFGSISAQQRGVGDDIQNSLLETISGKSENFETRAKNFTDLMMKLNQDKLSVAKESVDISSDIDAIGRAAAHDLESAKSHLNDASYSLSKISTDVVSGLTSDFSRLNSSIHQNLTILNRTVDLWTSNSPKAVSDKITDYIKSLGDKNMALMDSIAKKANGIGAVGIMQGAADFNSASANVLNQVSSFSGAQIAGSSDREKILVTEQDRTRTELGEISEQIKSLKSNDAQVTSFNTAPAANDAQAATHAISAALASSNNSMNTLAAQTESESGFKSNLVEAQSLALVHDANSTAAKVDAVVEGSSLSLSSSESDGRIDVDRMTTSVSEYGSRLKSKLAMAEHQMSSLDSNLTSNISNDKSQLDLQLMMAKRATSQLLHSWSDYADFQTNKFKKMNQSDAIYIDLMSQKLNSTNSNEGSHLKNLHRQVNDLNTKIVDVVSDYLGFSNIVSADLTGYKESVDLLNRTTEAGIDQLQESAFNFNANDDFIDKSKRSELANAVKTFESELDKRASQVEKSVGITKH